MRAPDDGIVFQEKAEKGVVLGYSKGKKEKQNQFVVQLGTAFWGSPLWELRVQGFTWLSISFFGKVDYP
jgi:hypothetical protein